MRPIWTHDEDAAVLSKDEKISGKCLEAGRIADQGRVARRCRRAGPQHQKHD
jgi:hypothetical protein